MALKQYSELMQSNPEALKSAFAHVDVSSTIELARGCLEHHKRQVASQTGRAATMDGGA